jgi:methyl-accepting chemotaxis protein
MPRPRLPHIRRPKRARARARRTVRAGLGFKLFGLNGTMLAITLVVALLSLHGIAAVSDDGHQIYGTSMVPLKDLGDARGQFNADRAVALQHVLEGDTQVKQQLRSQITAGQRSVDASLKRVESSLNTKAAHEAFESLTNDVDQYNRSLNSMLDLSQAGKPDEAYAEIVSETTPIGDAVTEDFTKVFAMKAALGKQADHAAGGKSASVKREVVILLIAALLLGFIMSLRIVRGVRRTVVDVLDRLAALRDRDTTDLREGLLQMEHGDLTRVVTPTAERIDRITGDELGAIAKAVNDVRDNTAASVESYNASRVALAAMLGEMTSAATEVTSAAGAMATTSHEAGRAVGEIARAMEHVVEGAERQVHIVGAAAERIDEVATVSIRSAEEAEETARAASAARQVAAQGSAAVTDATEAMTAVRTASAQATDAIRELGAKSGQIGGIVDAITGIAEQTNLLALNAAIEAARAGEQGRGFAVVADEVRKLAEESQQAAASIAGLIREIQAETSRVVEVVEAGAARTEEGTRTVEQARDGFSALDASVSDMVARVEGIAQAVGRIARSAEAMREEIGEVTAVAEQTSASSEQVSASTEQTAASTHEIGDSAEALRQTAHALEQLAARFTV